VLDPAVEDVTDTLDIALGPQAATRPMSTQTRPFGGNGPSCFAGNLAIVLKPKALAMFPASRYTRRPRGKIELWNQTLKNCILLENYFLPRDIETQIEALIEHYKSPVLGSSRQRYVLRHRNSDNILSHIAL
jgi:putative transposase